MTHRRDCSAELQPEEQAEREAGEKIWQAVEGIPEKQARQSQALADALTDLFTPAAENNQGWYDLDDWAENLQKPR